MSIATATRATPIATVKGSTAFTDSGLTSGTTYTYQVAAFDAAVPANVSAPTSVLSVSDHFAKLDVLDRRRHWRSGCKGLIRPSVEAPIP